MNSVICLSLYVSWCLDVMIRVADLKQSVVDVRDAAKAHRLALETKESDGQRLCCIGHYDIGFLKTAKTVKGAVKDYGYKITTTEAPGLVLRLLAIFDPKIAVVRAALNTEYPELSNEKIRKILKMEFIPIEQTIEDHAHALVQLGVDNVKMTKKYRGALERGDIKEYKH